MNVTQIDPRLRRDGNSPPALVDERPDPLPPLAKKVDELLANSDRWLAERAEIKDDAEAGLLAAAIEQVRAVHKAVEAAHDTEKRPYLDGGRLVDAKWKPLIAQLDASITVLRRIATAWTHVLRERQEAEARAKRAEAERAARVAQQLADAAENGSARLAIAAANAKGLADTAALEAARAEAKKPQLKGNLSTRAISLRKRRVVAGVTDLGAAMAHYATDPQMYELVVQLANRELAATKDGEIPGIKWKIEETVA